MQTYKIRPFYRGVFAIASALGFWISGEAYIDRSAASSNWLLYLSISLALLIVAIYFGRYSITLGQDVLIERAFFERKVSYSQIASLEVTFFRGPIALLKLKNGRTISLDGWIKGFSDLVDNVKKRIANSRGDSPSI